MKSLSTCALLALLAAPITALATDARPAKPNMDLKVPPYDLNTQVFDFPTGLRIIMQSDRTSPVVMTFSTTNHGTKDDPTGKEEVAHFVEHTWFRSEHLDPVAGQLPPIMNFIQDIGADFNAYTANDNTNYYLIAQPKYLEQLLRLESFRLTEPYKGVTEAEIDVEREVIRSEWRRRSEQSIALLIQFMYESVYPADHPYHDHSNHESIDNIKLADLQKFFDQYYTPQETTIVVMGNFDPDEAASLIFSNFAPQLLHPKLTERDLFNVPRPGIKNPDRKNPDHWYTYAYDPESDPNNRTVFQFASVDKPRITEARPPLPPLGTTEVATKYGPVDNKTLIIGWSLPGGFRSDEWNLRVLGNLTSNYVFGGLFEWQDNEQIDFGGCTTWTEIENSTLFCYVDILDKKLDPLTVRDKMVDQLSQMWNPENLTPNTPQNQANVAFLQRSKMEAVADQLLTLDQFYSRAENLSFNVHYRNDTKAVSAAMNAVMTIEPAQVAKIANEYLRRDRVATVIVEPLEKEDIDIGSEKSSYAGARMDDDAIQSADDLKSFTPDKIAETYAVSDLSEKLEFELPNKMKVIVVPHGEAPVVRASLVLRRNPDEEPALLREFVGQFTESAAHDPLAIAGEVSWIFQPGVPGITPNTAYPFEAGEPGRLRQGSYEMNIRVPSGNLDAGLWILREEIESAHPMLDNKSRWVDNLKDRVEGSWGSREFFRSDAVNAFLYPGDASRRNFTWEEKEAAKSWSGATINEYLAKTLRPENATLVIVGAIDPAKGQELATQYFGGWTAKGETPLAPGKPAAMPTEQSKTLVFDVPKNTQTDVRRYCRLNIAGPQDRAAVNVLGSLVAERIFGTMRVKEGLAYSPRGYTSMDDDLTGYMLFDSNGAVNSGVGRMLEFFEQTIRSVETGQVSADELTLHRLREARSAGLASQSVNDLSNLIVGRVARGDGTESITNWGQQLANVSVADLQRLVAGCGDHSITTIEGPKEVLLPQLDERGYTYDVVEWSGMGQELLFKYDPKEAKKQEKDRQKAAKKKAKEDAKKEGSP